MGELTERMEGNFAWLLVSLVFITLSTAVVTLVADKWALLVWEFMVQIALVVGIWTLMHDRKWFYTSVGLVSLNVMLLLLEVILRTQFLVYVFMLLLCVFYSLALVFTVRAMIALEKIDANSIIGAICVFIMAAYLWAMAYSFVFVLKPQAFNGIAPETPFIEMLNILGYFSFVTITTLGYGDISPAGPLVRALAYLEAMFGQFFIAVFVAGMVSVHVTNKLAGKGPGQ